MSADEVRLAVQIIGGVATIGTILWAALSQRKRLDHLDDCLDDLKLNVTGLSGDVKERETEGRQFERELSYLKGVTGVPLDAAVSEPPKEGKT